MADESEHLIADDTVGRLCTWYFFVGRVHKQKRFGMLPQLKVVYRDDTEPIQHVLQVDRRENGSKIILSTYAVSRLMAEAAADFTQFKVYELGYTDVALEDCMPLLFSYKGLKC